MHLSITNCIRGKRTRSHFQTAKVFHYKVSMDKLIFIVSAIMATIFIAADCQRIDYQGCAEVNRFFNYSLLKDYGDGRKQHMISFTIPENNRNASIPTTNWAVLIDFDAPGQFVLSSWSLRPSVVTGEPIQWFEDVLTGFAHFYSNDGTWAVGRKVEIKFNTNIRRGQFELPPFVTQTFIFLGNFVETRVIQNKPAPATPAEVDAECIKFDGGFVPAVDCTKYYRCDHGQKYLQSCPSVLEWNPNKQTCDWHHSAGCSQPVPKRVTCDFDGVNNCKNELIYGYQGSLCQIFPPIQSTTTVTPSINTLPPRK